MFSQNGNSPLFFACRSLSFCGRNIGPSVRRPRLIRCPGSGFSASSSCRRRFYSLRLGRCTPLTDRFTAVVETLLSVKTNEKQSNDNRLFHERPGCGRLVFFRRLVRRNRWGIVGPDKVRNEYFSPLSSILFFETKSRVEPLSSIPDR
jgi:hypothetical protein